LPGGQGALCGRVSLPEEIAIDVGERGAAKGHAIPPNPNDGFAFRSQSSAILR